MKGNVILRAGTPNDENRDYVPLGIPGTDMTVNENGNNLIWLESLSTICLVCVNILPFASFTTMRNGYF